MTPKLKMSHLGETPPSETLKHSGDLRVEEEGGMGGGRFRGCQAGKAGGGDAVPQGKPLREHGAQITSHGWVGSWLTYA